MDLLFSHAAGLVLFACHTTYLKCRALQLAAFRTFFVTGYVRSGNNLRNRVMTIPDCRCLRFLRVALWTAIDLLFLGWILRLWFAPEQVAIANGTITVTQGLFGKRRQMAAADVTAIHAAGGGYTRYHRIRILGTRGRGIAVGDGIRERRDAEWLALKMSLAAGVKPGDPIPS